MGTNYYAQINKCKVCGKPDDEIHIGKSSYGWRFNIQINFDFYKDWDEFISFIKRKDVKIYDEYKTEISPEDLLSLIESKKNAKSHLDIYQESKGFKYKFADLCNEEFS